MPAPLTLKPHLTANKLHRRYRRCRQAREKVRWQALWRIAQGDVANHAARRVGRSSGWISELVRRYNAEGPAAVKDRIGPVRGGRPRTVQGALADELDAALAGAAPDGGLWTAPKVAAWIKAQTGASVSEATAWRTLRRLNFTLQVPRPAHRDKAGEVEQAAFKKNWTKRSRA
jgi:transposase